MSTESASGKDLKKRISKWKECHEKKSVVFQTQNTSANQPDSTEDADFVKEESSMDQTNNLTHLNNISDNAEFEENIDWESYDLKTKEFALGNLNKIKAFWHKHELFERLFLTYHSENSDYLENFDWESFFQENFQINFADISNFSAPHSQADAQIGTSDVEVSTGDLETAIDSANKIFFTSIRNSLLNSIDQNGSSSKEKKILETQFPGFMDLLSKLWRDVIPVVLKQTQTRFSQPDQAKAKTSDLIDSNNSKTIWSFVFKQCMIAFQKDMSFQLKYRYLSECCRCSRTMGVYQYKCLECENFYLCCNCVERRECSEEHKINHILIRSDDPFKLFGMDIRVEDLSLENFVERFKSEVHPNHFCREKGCMNKEPIKGVRLKCDTCYDFNICLNCRKWHPADHILVAYGKTISLEVKREDIKLYDKLGSGSYGEVFKATYKGEKCACKLFSTPEPSENMTPDIGKLESAKRERTAYNEIVGKNVLKMIGYCPFSNSNIPEMILIERMERGSLHDVLKKEPNLSYWTRFAIATDIAAGLARIHLFNYAHGDLRPPNILIDENYNAKIADLGLAEIIKDSNVHIDRDVGTRSGKKGNKSADVHSFGLTLNQIYGGSHTDQGVIEDRAKLIRKFVVSCMNSKSELLPTAQLIYDTLYNLKKHLDNSTYKNDVLSEKNSAEYRETFFTELAIADKKYKEDNENLKKEAWQKTLEHFTQNFESLKTKYPNYERIEVIDALVMMGDVYYETQDSTNALKYYQEALVKVQHLHDKENEYVEADCYESIGNTYFYLLNDTTEALAHHQKALALRQTLFGEKTPHPCIARSFQSIGDCLYGQELFEKAVENYKNAFKIGKVYYNTSTKSIYTLECIKNCYDKLNDKVNFKIYEKNYLENKKLLINSKYSDGRYVNFDLIREPTNIKQNYWTFMLVPSEGTCQKSTGENGTQITQEQATSCNEKGYWDLDLRIKVESNISDLPDFRSGKQDPIYRYIYSNLKFSYEFFNCTSNVSTIKWLKELNYYFIKLKDAENSEACASALIQMCHEIFGDEDTMLTSDALICQTHSCMTMSKKLLK